MLIGTIYTSNCALEGVTQLSLDDDSFGDSGVYGDQTIDSTVNATTPQLGFCPSEGEGVEVHIALRDHGPVTNSPKDILPQLTNAVSPMCSSEGGPNHCLLVGASATGPITEDAVIDASIVNFMNFPPGCADAGMCDPVEEALQLGNSGSNALFIRTGDALQVIVNIQIDDLPEDYFSD